MQALQPATSDNWKGSQLDGVAIIIHTNPRSKLKVDQVGQIFSGEIENWKHGGNNGPISLYLRPQAGCGTFRTSDHFVLLNLTFRFRTGSTSLDTKALDDLNRLVEYVKALGQSRGLLLIGHADNSGPEDKNVKLSKDRAECGCGRAKVAMITVAGTGGEGSKSPVVSNDSPEGRQQNRRVEIWSRM